MLRWQFTRIDAIKAVGIDRHHLLAVRTLAARKALDATGPAEQVMDHMLVEQIFGQLPLTLEQRELVLGRKGQH
jgi:hypothetical protein